MKKSIHPDEVFESLKIASKRSQKIRNLETLHALCSGQFQGSKDYSLPVIGKLWEATGGIMARALYNAASEDYRTLISAWEKYAGPHKPAASPTVDSKNPAYLSRIDDPAIRSLVQAALIERDKLKAEVNLLKSLTHFQIDLSPKTITPVSTPLIEEASKPNFTASEFESLEKALSQKNLLDQGWKEGPNGEILNDRGRRVFDAGFCSAIRKAIKTAQPKQKRVNHGI